MLERLSPDTRVKILPQKGRFPDGSRLYRYMKEGFLDNKLEQSDRRAIIIELLGEMSNESTSASAIEFLNKEWDTSTYSDSKLVEEYLTLTRSLFTDPQVNFYDRVGIVGALLQESTQLDLDSDNPPDYDVDYIVKNLTTRLTYSG